GDQSWSERPFLVKNAEACQAFLRFSDFFGLVVFRICHVTVDADREIFASFCCRSSFDATSCCRRFVFAYPIKNSDSGLSACALGGAARRRAICKADDVYARRRAWIDPAIHRAVFVKRRFPLACVRMSWLGWRSLVIFCH